MQRLAPTAEIFSLDKPGFERRAGGSHKKSQVGVECPLPGGGKSLGRSYLAANVDPPRMRSTNLSLLDRDRLGSPIFASYGCTILSAVARLVEQRIRNALAAIWTRFVLYQSVLIYQQKLTLTPFAVPVYTGPCYRVG